MPSMQSPWGVERRDNLEVIEALQANPAPRNWCYIPESELPESWSCSWADCFWNVSEQDMLCRRYPLNCPNPIMFFTDWPNTVLLESGGIFYLYGQEHEELSEFYRAILGPSSPKQLLYRFDGAYSSIADFLACADWTKMSLVVPRRIGGLFFSLLPNALPTHIQNHPFPITTTLKAPNSL
jgi:hypothetical protein